MANENPVKDFTDCLELAAPKTKQYFELFEKRAIRLLNGPWYRSLFKKKIYPQHKIIQDADKRVIMVYWWDEKRGIIAPPMKISYKRNAEGKIVNTYKLDTEPFLKK